MNWPRLSSLPWTARVGLTGIVLTMLAGLAASLAHVREHHHKRDGQTGLSLDDLLGAYAGLHSQSPLAGALQRAHPENLPANVRQALLDWLASDKLTEQYDALDLGALAPAELLDQHCLSCHARTAEQGAGIGASVPLDYWDDVKKLAFSRDLEPTALEILIVSTHTHALSLAVVVLAIMGLVHCTRFSRSLCGWISMAGGLGLAMDIGGWWLTRAYGGAFVLVIAGGALLTAHIVLGSLLTLAELWLPLRGGDHA